jgi:hypothetical protein
VEAASVTLPEQRDPRVPYRALAEAETKYREKFPEALMVRALWTPSHPDAQIHVEVWTANADGLPVAEVYA